MRNSPAAAAALLVPGKGFMMLSRINKRAVRPLGDSCLTALMALTRVALKSPIRCSILPCLANQIPSLEFPPTLLAIADEVIE
jgi:hypothetical protein